MSDSQQVRNLVLQLLRSDDSSLPEWEEKLVAYGPDLVHLLSGTSHELSFYNLENIAAVLKKINDPVVVDRLLEERLSNNASVKSFATMLLGYFPEKRVVDALLNEISLPFGSYESAADTLERIDDPDSLLPMLQVATAHRNPNVRETGIVTALGLSAATPELILTFVYDDNLRIASGALRRLAAMAHSGNEIAETLMKEALPHFVVKLNSEDPSVASSGALALGIIGDRAAVPLLIQRFEKFKNVSYLNEMVKGNIASALGDIKDPIATEHIIPLLKSPNQNAQYSAIIALGKIGDNRACTELSDFLTALNGEEIYSPYFPPSIAPESYTSHPIKRSVLHDSIIKSLSKCGCDEVAHSASAA